VNSKGIPFFCEFGRNRLASIDPQTMEITEYPLPEAARPRRIAITPDDMVYYTDYARGRIGWLDPKTGATGDVSSPGGDKSAPYGMASTPDGILWYSESGVRPNTIVRFDPKTKTFASWPIPSGGGVVRHMVASQGGDLYIACSGENKVGTVVVSRAVTP
jgi:virginiamycin B lyase